MILIVDDCISSRKMLAMQCHVLGYTLTQEAASGIEAIELLKNEQVQLVLLDLMMPSLNGFQTAKAIRRMGEPICLVPIAAICYTYTSNRAISETCRRVGIDMVLFRPFLSEEISGTLARFLSPDKQALESIRLSPDRFISGLS